MIAVLAALALQACSPTKPPVQELDAASRALSAASTAEAPLYAPNEYRSAGQRYDQAQAAEARQDYDAAAQLAAESSVDSELASAKARLGKARQDVQKLKQDNANLDSDLNAHPAPEDQP